MSRRGARGRSSSGPPLEPHGLPLRTGLRLDDVLARAQPGDALVIDVLDMDRPTARRILAAQPTAVLNVSPSFSGRFPVTGPTLLVEEGVVLVDALGIHASLLRDGERIEVRADGIAQHGRPVERGRRRHLADLTDDAASAGSSGGVRIRTEAFVADAVALLRGRSDGAPMAIGQELADLVQGRAVVLITGALTSHEVRALGALPDRVVAVAGPAGEEAARSHRMIVQVVLGEPRSRTITPEDGDQAPPARRRTRTSDAAPRPDVLRIPAPDDRPLADGAAALILAAGARAVVVAGPDGVDDPLMGLLDRPRAEAASTGLLRLDAGGRLVALSALEALTERPRSGRRDRSGQESPWLATPLRRGAAVAGALLMATAIGVLVAIGPLARFSPTGADLAEQVDAVDSLRASNSELARQGSAADAFISAQEGALVEGQLTGRRLVVVSAPGIEPAVVQGIDRVLAQSGATVAGTVALAPAFTAPAKQASLDDIAARLAPVDAAVVAGTAGARARAALAASISTPTGSAVGAPVQQGQGLLDAFVQVGAIQVNGTPSQRSDLVVLVVPDGGTAATSQILADLGVAFAGRSVTTVMSAPGTPRAGSAIAVARAVPQATVRLSVSEQAARAIGRVSIIQALVAGIDGRFGVFGGVGNPVAAPVQSPAATPAPTPR